MKKIRLLFQGDSITAWGRNYDDEKSLGEGYVRSSSEGLEKKFPDIEFEFINRGVSGNESCNLAGRVEKDFVDLQPDIVSIMVGINDVWHHAEKRDWVPDDEFERNMRIVLDALRNKTTAKIMIIEPFLLPVEDKLFFRQDLAPKIEIIRKLAREYADVYMPADGLIQSEIIGKDPSEYAKDGVHLAPTGIAFFTDKYIEYISEIILKLLKD